MIMWPIATQKSVVSMLARTVSPAKERQPNRHVDYSVDSGGPNIGVARIFDRRGGGPVNFYLHHRNCLLGTLITARAVARGLS